MPQNGGVAQERPFGAVSSFFGSHFVGAIFGSRFWEPLLEAALRSRHNVEAPGATPREPGAVFGAVFHDYIKRI